VNPKRAALVVVVHAGVLVVPILVAGRSHVLVTPRGMACVGLLLLLSVLEPAALRTSASTSRTLRESPLAIASGLALLVTAWFSIAGVGTGVATGAARAAGWCWIGAVAAVIGIGLRVVAIRDLGASFTSTIRPPPDARLVMRGIYGRVRHPSDLGLLLIAAGLALLGGSLAAGLVVLAAVVPSIAIRLVLEERALFAQFGATHQAYRARVSALLPIVGRG
jgi:protein-S-isoprenylcysteine O-methyltransferase Ste14